MEEEDRYRYIDGRLILTAGVANVSEINSKARITEYILIVFDNVNRKRISQMVVEEVGEGEGALPYTSHTS